MRDALVILLSAATVLGTAGTAAATPATSPVPSADGAGDPQRLDSAPVDGDAGLRRFALGGVRTAARTPIVVSRPLADVARKAIWGTTQHVTYLWGGGHGGTPPSKPDRTDCSGFSRWAYWTALGYDISGDSSEGMRTSGQFTKVVGEPQPGDAVFFGKNGTGPSYHMAIYIGRNGEGTQLIAENSSTKVEAHISSLDTPYRQQNLLGFYRLTAVKFSGLLKQTVLTRTLSPVAATVGTPSKISGTLRILNSPTPVVGVPVYLDLQNPDGTFRTVRRAVTSSSGGYTFAFQATGVLRAFRVHYTGNWNPTMSTKTPTMYQTGKG